jgi:hypothetical protein
MFRPPADGPVPDVRDDEEKAEVARILCVLPEDHPAHAAHRSGADTIRLSHLVADRADLVHALVRAYMAGLDRVWKRSARVKV